MKYDETYYRGKRKEAREAGRDFVQFTYKHFNAVFLNCVHCDWVEYTDAESDWREDPEVQATLLKHSIDHHKEGEFLDGTR